MPLYTASFVDGNNIQTGAIVGDSEANFFPNFKDGSFVASPSVHIATLGSFGISKSIYSMPKVSSYCSLSVTCLGFLYIYAYVLWNVGACSF